MNYKWMNEYHFTLVESRDTQAAKKVKWPCWVPNQKMESEIIVSNIKKMYKKYINCV